MNFSYLRILFLTCDIYHGFISFRFKYLLADFYQINKISCLLKALYTLSKGPLGWNMVTTCTPFSAYNLSDKPVLYIPRI